MKITKIKNVRTDVLKSIVFCCEKMNNAVMSVNQIEIVPKFGVCVKLVPSEYVIDYCPFCGSEIKILLTDNGGLP